MAAQEEYQTLKSLVIESLTLSQDDFEQLLPPKLRGEKEAEDLYAYVKEELESRKSRCMEYISQIPQVFDGTITIEEVQKRMKKMEAIKRSADRGIVLMQDEVKRRKQDLQELKNVVSEGSEVDSSLVNEVLQLCKDIKNEFH